VFTIVRSSCKASQSRLSVNDLALPEDVGISSNFIHRAVAGKGDSLTFQKRYRHRQGQTIHGEVSSSLVRDASGKPMYFISQVQDITERKRMEMLLRTSEEMYRSLFEGMIDGFVTVATDGRILNFNKPYQAMLGYSRTELAQLTYRDITPEKWHSFEADIVENQILKRGYSDVYEKEYRRKDGSIFPVELHCVLTRDEHGNPSAIWSIIRDITERKRAEELKLMMLEMLDAAPCSITVHDAEGRFYYANQKASHLHGYDKDEFMSHNLRDLVVPEYVAKLPERYQTLNEKGELTFETIHYRKNGTTFPLEVFSKKSTWDGRPTFLSIATDITLRKQSELALKQSTARAEALAAEAEEATRFKSEFLAKMTHELRTPLSGMLGFSELLFETPLNADQKLYAKTIKKSGEHLLSIINDVLDLSSIESGKLAIQSASFALAELVESSVLPIRKSAIAKGLGFRCEIDPGLPECIVGDERRIRQVLINLLGNAVKFTSSGSVGLHVTASSTGEQPSMIFSVEDTGPGIASESLSNLFKLFTQADATIGQKFGGTGLGLAISKQLADAMNGSISVDSTPDKGTTFTFRLPLEVSPPDSKNC
jgi:two-component system, sensor histidine kinase and response regulator